ncbi:MAG TPA: IclR family transcriptional regulator [Rhodobacteraceae bacterium]|nr:IclR family transcriptional regulator [Paracoccaceae bacterium]
MGTVSKALSLLGFFNHQRTEIGLSDLTRLSGLNKATVFRLMAELQEGGFVEQTGEGRAYRLGPEVLRLAALREAAVPVLSVSRAILDALAEETGETAHLSLLRGGALHTLAHAYSARHATRVMMDDAEVLSFHGTSSGLAVLAFAPEPFIEAVLAAPLPAHTAQTETDPQAVRRALAGVRETGLACSRGGFEAEVHSHGIPLFGPDRAVMGALAVAAPASRMTPEHAAMIRAALRRAGAEMTRRIGGCPPDHWPREDAA